ncbi:hypothetical protein ABZX34_24820 [Streptomyces sp. NPDC004362]|uniref:hypothetical protein n=1 Tax=Streptomyces sp. NPDC004362 TaxID=3154456 RepID=UPI0033AB5329
MTGDQVSVSQEGNAKPQITVGGRTAGVGYLSYTVQGDTYVIPSSAEPYVGRQLDLDLFNVSKLIRDGRADSAEARIPVHLEYTGEAHPATPGVILTDSTTSGANGYITPKTAHLFGEALTEQTAANVKAGWRQSDFLEGVAALSTDGVGRDSGSTVTPYFPMRTTKVHVLDAAGNPASHALVIIYNTDDLKRTNRWLFIDGEATLSLPTGNYAAVSSENTFDSAGHLTSVRQLTENFVVPDDPSQRPSATLDFREASTPVTVSTSQPTTVGWSGIDWIREDATGQRFTAFSQTFGGIPLLVKPDGPVNVGKLFFAARARLFGTGDHTSDVYNTIFTDNQVRANQNWQADKHKFATVPYRYSSDVPGPRSARLSTNVRVGDNQLWPATTNVTVPGTYNEHFLTGPGIQWGATLNSLSNYNIPEASLDLKERSLKPRRYAPVTWGHGPLVPYLPPPDQNCYACRWSNEMKFYFAPLSDDELHTGGAPFAAQDAQLYLDGQLLADQQGYGAPYDGANVTNLPADRHMYRVVFDQTRSGDSFTHGTRSHTEWSFPSEATPKGDLPPQMCSSEPSNSSCEQLPALIVTHRLNTDTSGVSRDKTTVLHMKVANNSSTKSHPTSTSVQVSFDHGTTWRTARRIGHQGQEYTFRWRNPDSARGIMPMLRVEADDTAHSSFTETIWDAYTVGPVS